MSPDLPRDHLPSISEESTLTEFIGPPELPQRYYSKLLEDNLSELDIDDAVSFTVLQKDGRNQCIAVFRESDGTVIKNTSVDIPPEILEQVGTLLIEIIVTSATTKAFDGLVDKIKQVGKDLALRKEKKQFDDWYDDNYGYNDSPL